MKRLRLAATVLALGACNGQFRFEEADAAIGAAAKSGSGSTGCKVDSDCQLASLHCDAVSGACVGCTTDAHCVAPGEKRCDSALHRCIACGTSADCGPKGACEPNTHQCLTTCVDKTEKTCPATAPTCDEQRGICIACQKDADCAGTDDGNLCETSNGRCAFCISDDQCPSIWPRCDRTDGRCRQCLTSADCEHNEPCDPVRFTCL